MTTGEIRNKLAEQKALYRQSQLAMEQAVSEINEIFRGIDAETRERLRGKGFDVSVLDFDLERLQGNEAAIEEFKIKLAKLTKELHEYLERSLIACTH